MAGLPVDVDLIKELGRKTEERYKITLKMGNRKKTILWGVDCDSLKISTTPIPGVNHTHTTWTTFCKQLQDPMRYLAEPDKFIQHVQKNDPKARVKYVDNVNSDVIKSTPLHNMWRSTVYTVDTDEWQFILFIEPTFKNIVEHAIKNHWDHDKTQRFLKFWNALVEAVSPGLDKYNEVSMYDSLTVASLLFPSRGRKRQWSTSDV